MRNRRIVYGHKVEYEASCVAVHPGQTEVAVGSGDGRVSSLQICDSEHRQANCLADARLISAPAQHCPNTNCQYLFKCMDVLKLIQIS